MADRERLPGIEPGPTAEERLLAAEMRLVPLGKDGEILTF